MPHDARYWTGRHPQSARGPRATAATPTGTPSGPGQPVARGPFSVQVTHRWHVLGPMQGDTWNRQYSRSHARLPACELCGHVEKPPTWVDGIRDQPRGWLVWDHCHEHGIVRGTLCVACNNEEAVDSRAYNWGDRFTEWRKRCRFCCDDASGSSPAG